MSSPETIPLDVQRLDFEDGQTAVSAHWNGFGVKHDFDGRRFPGDIAAEVELVRNGAGAIIAGELRLKDTHGTVAFSQFLVEPGDLDDAE